MSPASFQTAPPRDGKYPFHMPGHKRQDKLLTDPYEIDITEISDFDNLHHPDYSIKKKGLR